MTTKEKVKALWKHCFEDSEEFTEMYFRLRYSNDVNIALKSGNEIISALQMLPYPMTFCGKEIQTSYISGACTHPDHRKQGMMRKLLSRAFNKMQQNEVPLSTLIPAEPWLFDYYAQMGYALVFWYAQNMIPPSKVTPNESVSISKLSAYDEEVYQYFNRKMQERPCCIQHTSDDFKVILADLAIRSSCLYVARNKGKITGIATAFSHYGSSFINEILTEDRKSKHTLMDFIRRDNEDLFVTLIAPPRQKDRMTKLGMARVINAQTILELYAAAHPEKEINIELTDPQIEINNAYYYLSNGKCTRSTESLASTHQSFNIAELCKWIFEPLRPYMSLMLN